MYTGFLIACSVLSTFGTNSIFVYVKKLSIIHLSSFLHVPVLIHVIRNGACLTGLQGHLPSEIEA